MRSVNEPPVRGMGCANRSACVRRAVQQQLNEMTQFQSTLYDLERTHQKMKAQYEEEIHRLRRELEFRGVGGAGTRARARPLFALWRVLMLPDEAGGAATFSAGGGPAPVGASTDAFSGASLNGSAAKRARTDGGPPFPTSSPLDDKERDSKSVCAFVYVSGLRAHCHR